MSCIKFCGQMNGHGVAAIKNNWRLALPFSYAARCKYLLRDPTREEMAMSESNIKSELTTIERLICDKC
jgi:hypothetical protein